MSEDKKSALLRATQKLKNAKKQKDSQSDVPDAPNKRAMNDESNKTDSNLANNIVNAVHNFKGD